MTKLRAIGWNLRRLAIAVAILIVLPGGFARISGEIYEWVDESGDHHYNTSLDQVPEDRRAEARVVVRAASSSSTDTAVANAPTPGTDEGAHAASFQSGWDEGFQAGWDAGYRAAAQEQPVCTAEPQLVVLESRTPVVVSAPNYDPSGVYYRSPYDGQLTQPFDNGVTFGLTTRGQIQQMRAMERGW